MMYENMKLEKSLYHLDGKSFTQALAEMDPDCAYAETELKGLDAFERQLKRFDIRVRGENADTVEKFFRTAESAVLFPEFVRRSVKQGMNTAMFGEIVAATTNTNAIDYRGFSVVAEENKPYTTEIAEGGEIPQTAITLDSELVSLKKFGRLITASYEAIRQQRLDLFAVTLRAIGGQISRAVLSQAIDVLMDGVTPKALSGSEFNYGELVGFWGEFKDYNMTTLIASPKTMAKILGFEQMKYANADFMATGMVKTPFGATLVKSTAVMDDVIIGLDKSSALEMINGSDIILESDKLINRQLDRTAVTVTTGFSKIIPEATMVLDATEA